MDKFLQSIIGQVGIGGALGLGFAFLALQIVREFRKDQQTKPPPMVKCPVAPANWSSFTAKFDAFLTEWNKQKYQDEHLAQVLEDLRDHLKEQTKALQAIATESKLSAQTLKHVASDIRELHRTTPVNN